MFRSASFLFLLILSILSACSSRITADRLADIETYIQDRPDSALSAIRAIDTTTLTTPKLRAHYALLHAMALDKNWIDTTDVNVVMPAVEYYDRHRNADYRSRAWYYLGRIQENNGLFSRANTSFLKAEKWAGEASDEYYRSLIYQSIANTYSGSYLFDEALKYSILSLESSERIGDSLGINASRFRIAQDLNNLNRHEEADSLFQILIQGEGHQISPQLYPQILSDYALIRLVQYDDYTAAVALFEDALNRVGYLRTPNHWGAYAYALLRTGRQSKSRAIFNQLETADDDNSLTYKTWRSRADAFEGNYAAAFDRMGLAAEIQQKNIARVLKQSTLREQIALQQQENESIRLRMARRNFISIALFLLFLAFAGGIIYYLRKRNLRLTTDQESMLEAFRILSNEQERLKLKNQEMSLEKESLKQSYQTLADEHSSTLERQAFIRSKYIDLFQNHLNQIGQIHYLLRHSPKDQNTHLYRELKNAIGSILTDDEGNRQFEMILNESLNNVMLHFRDCFPERKPRFYQFASFLFAGFDATVISNLILDLSKDNVYVEKHRLKQLIRNSDCNYKEQFLNLLS